jgi:hypothetical protein
MVVMSTESGKVIADLPIGAGVDAVKIDSNEYFASAGDGTLAVVGSSSPGKYALVQSVKTPIGAKTMGVDDSTHKIYLPTADFEAAKAGANGRRVAKPGTFKIIVVSQ